MFRVEPCAWCNYRHCTWTLKWRSKPMSDDQKAILASRRLCNVTTCGIINYSKPNISSPPSPRNPCRPGNQTSLIASTDKSSRVTPCCMVLMFDTRYVWPRQTKCLFKYLFGKGSWHEWQVWVTVTFLFWIRFGCCEYRVIVQVCGNLEFSQGLTWLGVDQLTLVDVSAAMWVHLTFFCYWVYFCCCWPFSLKDILLSIKSYHVITRGWIWESIAAYIIKTSSMKFRITESSSEILQ